ncbi:putative glycine cleavage T protein [Sterolibacterium denitrificans]|uniref:Glycine cleavage T protein n=1 Tax=Sterolibacterium denitrificans TaxID=157592 RepID=A0A7Z7HSL0_9PROT|nr:folate-binding protein YgfZ [Sterolibacterium denitrificans]SMB28061.1 putative glycine cleavage T protein [Sterolibacterium denitrificans]
MNPQWQDFLTQQGLAPDHLDFGQPLAELQSAQSASILVPLTDLGLIRASGADAASFLHNLLTNDIEALAANGANRSGLCTPKGRLLATFLAWRDEDDLLLALADDLHAGILKKLSMYVLRAKVKLSDASDERIILGLAGPQAEQALAALAPLPATNMQTNRFEQGRIIRIGEQRYWLVAEAAAAPALWQQLAGHARPAGLNAWRWLEIAAGIPQISAATREEFTPQMVNYELIGGVSFKKGCYPGQEIVARTQYLGKVKRRMYRAHVANATGAMPAAGTPVFAADDGNPAPQLCGMVVNAAASPQGGHDVLAVLQSASADAGQLHLGSGDGPLLVTAPLPYALG